MVAKLMPSAEIGTIMYITNQIYYQMNITGHPAKKIEYETRFLISKNLFFIYIHAVQQRTIAEYPNICQPVTFPCPIIN